MFLVIVYESSCITKIPSNGTFEPTDFFHFVGFYRDQNGISEIYKLLTPHIHFFITTWYWCISYFKDESESKLGNYQKDLLRYVLGIRELVIHETVLHPTFVAHGGVTTMGTEGDMTPDFLQAKILSVSI